MIVKLKVCPECEKIRAPFLFKCPDCFMTLEDKQFKDFESVEVEVQDAIDLVDQQHREEMDRVIAAAARQPAIIPERHRELDGLDPIPSLRDDERADIRRHKEEW